jgi:hypothetical protein
VPIITLTSAAGGVVVQSPNGPRYHLTEREFAECLRLARLQYDAGMAELVLEVPLKMRLRLSQLSRENMASVLDHMDRWLRAHQRERVLAG